MAKCVSDLFWFPEKLGRRQAELRRKRGLTQRQVGELMSRAGRESDAYVRRLERGRLRSPSLRLVGDYLRAFRASIRGIAGILAGFERLR
jgi:transcriptional regulator with XRE-family HTH domain